MQKVNGRGNLSATCGSANGGKLACPKSRPAARETGNWKEANSLYDTAKFLTVFTAGLFILLSTCMQVLAGNLEPPAGPDDPASAMYSIEAIYQRLSTGTNVARRTAGFRGPTAPPGSTMHNLNDVMAKAPSNVVDAATTNDVLSGKPFWGLTTNEWGALSGTMPDIGAVTYTPGTTDQAVAKGYHDGSGKVEGDADLVTTNIKKDVSIFGVTGTVQQTLIPKTGQTTSYREGDDGWCSTNYGISWPVPRFTIGTGEDGTNLVTDNMTGLMWARNANQLGIKTNWNAAIDFCNDLDYGGHTDWRLPNRKELESLLDLGRSSPALSSGHSFTGVQSAYYWTGTTCTHATDYAWGLDLCYGNVLSPTKATTYYVWPVRGGE